MPTPDHAAEVLRAVVGRLQGEREADRVRRAQELTGWSTSRTKSIWYAEAHQITAPEWVKLQELKAEAETIARLADHTERSLGLLEASIAPEGPPSPRFAFSPPRTRVRLLALAGDGREVAWWKR